MKRAIVTICCGELFQRYAALTHPTIRRYAERIGADFIVWDDYTGFSLPHYKKFHLGKLLEQYDRVLFIDTDIIVRDDAPDLFEIVPEDQLGMHEEGQYFPPFDRQYTVVDISSRMGGQVEGWNGKYYNSGVMVLSQAHRKLFTPPPFEPDNFGEQTMLNVLIWQTRTKVFPLSHQFNRFASMDRHLGSQRFDSYFLHYAGAKPPPDHDRCIEIARGDLEAWKAAAPAYHFRRRLGFEIKGPLAQHVAALPTIRFAHTVLFPGHQIAVVSDRSDVLLQLGLHAFRSREEVPDAIGYHWLAPVRPKHHPFRLPPGRQLLHPVQRYSFETLGIELPHAYRSIPLVADQAAVDRVRALVAARSSKAPIVLHAAGRNDNGTSGTFWQALLNQLSERGRQVAVIGNRGEGDFTCLPLDTSRAIDLVDRLSLAEIVALSSIAPAVLCGESPLVSIVGAFDAWIGLVAPREPGEFVLPWRRGSPFYRAATFEELDADAVVNFAERALSSPDLSAGKAQA